MSDDLTPERKERLEQWVSLQQLDGASEDEQRRFIFIPASQLPHYDERYQEWLRKEQARIRRINNLIAVAFAMAFVSMSIRLVLYLIEKVM